MSLFRPTWSAALTTLLVLAPAAAQDLQVDTIPVATVDFYGLTTIPDSVARRALGIETGAIAPDPLAAARSVRLCRGGLHG